MTDRITDDQLAELSRLCEEATPGPWHTADRLEYNDKRRRDVCFFKDGDEYDVAEQAEPADASFIATARNLMPALIAEVRRLRSALDEEDDEEAPTLSQRVARERAWEDACAQRHPVCNAYPVTADVELKTLTACGVMMGSHSLQAITVQVKAREDAMALRDELLAVFSRYTGTEQVFGGRLYVDGEELKP